jgi:hypothetical protein
VASSAQQQIENIIRSLEVRGIPAAPVDESLELATSHPEAVFELAIATIRRFPRGGTFLDAALSFLPDHEWPKLVGHALDTLESEQKNEAADSVIAYASLQSPTALHAHLTRIFCLRPNERTYYQEYPWRDSGTLHFEFLKTALAEDPEAWPAMLQTREPEVIEFALANPNLIKVEGFGFDNKQTWIDSNLHLVGYDRSDGGLKRICPETLYHLVFPESFFEVETPLWLARVHPSWKLPASNVSCSLGGARLNHCGLCQGQLHGLLALTRVPGGLGVTGKSCLELATCLSCLGWESQPLFYQHDTNGTPSSIAYDGPTIEPQFPSGPLKTADVQIARTPNRWYWQDWALSNGRENLNRLGGEPSWVQSAEYPHCPKCNRLMPFLMQLDSNLPMEDGGELLWGSGGIAYGFWCDHCRVSAFLWQCT